MITNFSVGTSTTTAAFTATGDVAVTVIYICNTSATDGDVDVYLVPNGATVGAQHLIYKNLIIRSNDTYIIDSEKLILGTGDRIFIAAPDSAGEFNATISTIGV
jgi:hypothetical protein